MKAVRHLGIIVSDLEKSLHFYRDLLGMKILKEMDEKGEYIDNILGLKEVVVRTTKMAADDGNLIELLCYKSHQVSINNRNVQQFTGCSHVAFTVEDLGFEYNRLKNAGILFNAPPQYSPDGFAKVTFCKDPDGTLIELVEELR